MNRQQRLAPWLGIALGTLCALLFMVVEGSASDHRAFTEEFHQTYTLTAGGRIDLSNINGAVHITGWDDNQVKVDAVKYAGSKERLGEAKIRVSSGSDYVSIHTEYADRTQTFSDDNDSDNPASVEYTLMVPRNARLDEIKLINGALDISGVQAEVRASSINGHLRAKGLSGRVRLSTINGRLEADFASPGNSIELSSVNGSVALTLPSDAKAEIEASTVHGGIENDFGLTKNDHRYVGHDLHGELGGGGALIELRNVNGQIELRHANDNRALSPARDLGGERASDRDDDDDDNL